MRNITVKFTDEDKQLAKKLSEENYKMYSKYLEKTEGAKIIFSTSLIACILSLLLFPLAHEYELGMILAAICFAVGCLSFAKWKSYGEKTSEYAWESNVVYDMLAKDMEDIEKHADEIQYSVNPTENTIIYTFPECDEKDDSGMLLINSGMLIVKNDIPENGDIVLEIKEFDAGDRINHGWFARTIE